MNDLLESILFATGMGCSVSFKAEGNQLSIRTIKKVDNTTFKQLDTCLPFDGKHAEDAQKVAKAVRFNVNKII